MQLMNRCGTRGGSAVLFSGWLRLLAALPPLAPVLMPARLALGAVSAWEMAVAVLLTLLAVYGMVRLAARIYAPALVRGGARLGWRAALRLRAE